MVLNQTLEAIEKPLEVRLDPVKLNVVVLKGVNENELEDLIKFAENSIPKEE